MSIYQLYRGYKLNDNRKKLIIRIEPELHKKLKIRAAEEERPYNELVTELIENYLKEGSK
jgi:predicted HicB family RNase H-like nuclease